MLSRRVFLKYVAAIGAPLFLGGSRNTVNSITLSSTLKAMATPKAEPLPLPIKEIVRENEGLFPNASQFIVTPTYEKYGQAVHPSVIDFKTEYGLESWRGFRYWMAFTPYPDAEAFYENPSLLVSHDGITWVNPPGIKNPVAPRARNAVTGNYNSDPELIYDTDHNQLILYWREYYVKLYEKIWAIKIDSNKIASKILCLENPWDHKDGLILSPTVWCKGANEWYMWTTNGNILMHLRTSQDGITWSSGQICSAPWDTWNGGLIPWHVNAKPNHSEHRIDFFIAGWYRNSSIIDSKLFFATTSMDQLTNIRMPLSQPLLCPNKANEWDNGYVYRSSFVIEPEASSSKYRVWYSACSKEKKWHIGYTEGKIDIPVSVKN